MGSYVLRAIAAVKYTSSGAVGDLPAGGPASGDIQGCTGGRGKAQPKCQGLGEGCTAPGIVQGSAECAAIRAASLIWLGAGA